VSDGKHTLTVTATDIAGKTGTQSVTFSKTTPYHPLYDGEVFYMPFDGDFVEQVNNKPPDSLIGTPGFVDGKIGKAYVGFPNSYVGFKTASIPGIPGTQFSMAFWYNLNAVPDLKSVVLILFSTILPGLKGSDYSVKQTERNKISLSILDWEKLKYGH
jgi:hypothetical protein